MERDWQPIETAPTGIVVWTKIDDVHGARNEALMKLYRRLWWIPDGSQYVYYTPTHWAPKKTAPICEHQWDGERIPFGESGSVATCSRCGEAAVDLRLLGEQTPQRAGTPVRRETLEPNSYVFSASSHAPRGRGMNVFISITDIILGSLEALRMAWTWPESNPVSGNRDPERRNKTVGKDLRK